MVGEQAQSSQLDDERPMAHLCPSLQLLDNQSKSRDC